VRHVSFLLGWGKKWLAAAEPIRIYRFLTKKYEKEIMSKNLTRKGLAFGALVALGASVFAGAPAFAADSMVLEANYTSDKTLAVPITETISLSASLGPSSTAANINLLKFKVVNNGALTVAYNSTNGTDVTGTVTSTEGSEYITPNTTSSVAANELQLNLDGEATTSVTQTVTVTAFLDASNFGVLDAGEVQTTQTITFVKLSEVTTATTITAPTENDTAVTAVVKFTNVNNQALSSANVGAFFSKGTGSALGNTTGDSITGLVTADFARTDSNTTVEITKTHALAAGDIITIAGSGAPTGTYSVLSVTGTTAFKITKATSAAITVATTATVTRAKDLKTLVEYSATAGGFKYTTSTITGLVKGSAVKVQPLLSTGLSTNAPLAATDAASATTVAAVAIGTAQTALVTANALSSIKGTHVLSTTAASAAETAAGVTNDVALNTEKQVYFKAYDTATTPAAKPGVAIAVTVTVPTGTLSSTVKLTVNGTTYTSEAALPGATGVAKLALTTGADGKAVITYKTEGLSDNDVVTFAALSENFTATVSGTEQTRDFSQYIENHEGDVASTTDGVAKSVVVVVQDQFGGKPANGTYQISATLVANNQVTAATSGVGSDTFAQVIDGKATLSLVDNGTGIGTAVFGLIRYSVNGSGAVSGGVSLRGTAINDFPAFSTTFATGAATVGGQTASHEEATRFDLQIVAAEDLVPGVVNLVDNAGGVAINGAGNTVATDLTEDTAALTTYGVTAAAGTTAEGSSADPAALTYSDFKSVDLRTIAATHPDNFAFNGTTQVVAVPVSGTVSSAATATYGGALIAGTQVTVAGTGAAFAVLQDGKYVYGSGSLTFITDNNGAFTVYVWSHVAGKNTVTITAGAAKATVYPYFAAAAQATASSVTVVVADAAAQFQAGRALDVTVTVKDKLGNPVALSAAADWNASGEAKLVVTQVGSGYLSTLGDGSTSATGAFTSKLITNAGDLGTSTITATVDFYTTTSTDLVKSVSSEFGVTDADVTVGGRAVYASVEFAKGKTVTVSVDGKRLYSKLFSTDAYTELKFTQKTAGKHVVTVRISGGIVYSESVTTTK
jgi:hypothetical protein